VQRYSKITSKRKGGRGCKEAVNHRVHLLNPEKRKNEKKKKNDFKARYGFKIVLDDKLSTCNIKTSLRA
jgi:hypothetical protein